MEDYLIEKIKELPHIKFTEDQELKAEILLGLEANDGNCPCMIKPVKCPCGTVDLKRIEKNKSCHCGLFELKDKTND